MKNKPSPLKHKIADIFHTAARSITKPFHPAAEFCRDVYAGFKPGATPKAEERIDEYKLIAGSVLTAFGIAETNPLAAASGSIPVCEALHDLEKHGHQWRVKHHKI